MRVFKIEGQRELTGTIEISGAKNSVVALISAAILSHGVVVIEDVPELSDVFVLLEMLKKLHAEVTYENHILTIDTTNLAFEPLIDEEVQKLRASYYLMGAMIGRFGRAVVGMPGGCYLGPRPIDLHIRGFEALKIDVNHENGAYVLTTEDGIKGARINLDIASVGATINLILAAVYAEGTTYIENAAKEPEIIDVTTLLNSMGANITGAGTDMIRIEGVERLEGCRHQIIPDRIVAASYMLVGAVAGNKLKINNIIPEHMEAFTAKLMEAGADIEIGEDYAIVSRIKEGQGVNIKTMTYPGFATDIQQPFTVFMTQLEGMSIVQETIYNARFKHVEELNRMGATIRQENASAIITGPTKLQGAKVMATDLRAGFAMVLAGLIAEGETEVRGIEHVERGYELIIEQLTAVGAKIRVEEIESTVE